MTDRRSDEHLLLALVALALAGVPVHGERVGPREATVFRAINGLPDCAYRPVWLVMQGGNVTAAPVSAAVALWAGRPALARRLLLAGTGTWALAKVVKRVYRRPRPAVLVAGTRTRGSAATGLGYVSGHAGVAVALTRCALPYLSPRARIAASAACSTIGLARVYVGAHLPLDVVGGAALGLVVEGAAAQLGARTASPARSAASASSGS